MKNIYLDFAAATPMDERVAAAMKPFQAQQFYNPSAQYLAAQAVADAVGKARAQVAHWLGARPGEVIFTAGGTEANNLAIHGVLRQFPGSNVVVSAVEHESVLAPAHRYDCREAAVTKEGIVDLESLASLIDDKTVLVSLMYANNEIGTIQPIKRAAEIIQTIRKKRAAESSQPLPLYLHTDACQAANYLDLQAARHGVDMMTLNGGKVYGPKQSGVLFVKSGVRLQPLIDGGGQEQGLRSGTENVAGAVGFAAALDIAQGMRHEEVARLSSIQQLFIQELKKAIPTIQINGSLKTRLPNNLHITLDGQDNERLMMAMDEQGIMCAVGSACSASKEEPSHVLRAIGLTDKQAQASLRFTLGRQTTEADVLHAVEVLASLL